MAKKSGNRLAHKDTTQNRKQDTLPDEITLRDEIFELKRQVMILKRTNEQYSVKLRKYENEAKRKDKQLEQLMDPRKNSDITKVLSTKGAAILMNLKDQNNALIQMILNKDLHIRRLTAEIKMSKLYASTKKNEDYRAEISRLRNLLIKSQETLKENIDFHEQSRSICVSGNSFLEYSSSSDQSSPRDFDELRMTILSLESHIQQSNELLSKKNQEISHLRDEVNFLKKFSRNKIFKKSFDCESIQCKDYEFFNPGSTYKQTEVLMPTKILGQDKIDLFKKNTNEEDEKLLNSKQNIFKKWISSTDSVSKNNFHSYASEETTELIETNQDNIEKVNKACSLKEKSLFHHLATDEIKREEKIYSNLKSTFHAKEKWKKALNRYKELKQLNPKIFSGCVQVEEVYLKYESKESEFSENEKILQQTIKITQNNHTLGKEDYENTECIEDTEGKLDNSSIAEFLKKETENTPKTSESSCGSDNEASETCQKSRKKSRTFKNENYETENFPAEKTLIEDLQQTKSQSPKHCQKLNNSNITQSSDTKQRVDPKYAELFSENYFQSLDSSFDSDYDYSVKQEVHQVQVEVQINSVSSQSDNDQSGNNVSETNQFQNYDSKNNENLTPELDFNDDDDVIIREK